MRRIVVAVIIAGLILVAFLVYRSRYSESKLNVNPEAQDAIEKAKRR
jgi:hypothetical protein